MTRRVLSGFVLLVVAALVAAPAYGWGAKYNHRELGYPIWTFGALTLSGEISSFAQDSVEAPAGYLIAEVRLFSHSTAEAAESLMVGFVKNSTVAYSQMDTVIADTLDAARMVICEGTAEVPGLAQAPWIFPCAAEKAYFYTVLEASSIAGDSDGTWYYEAYFIKAPGNGISGITWP